MNGADSPWTCGAPWRVAAVGVLHLDHVGAQIAEQHRAVRARELVREVEDAEAVERAGRHHGSVY